MKKENEFDLIKFCGGSIKLTFVDLFFFFYKKEFKLKRNYIPLTGIVSFSLYELIQLDILNIYTISIVPFLYFTPRSLIKYQIYQFQNKKYKKIFKEIGLSQSGRTPYFIDKFIIDKEDFNFKNFIFNLKQKIRKKIGIKYKPVKGSNRKKLFFKNNLEIESWINKKGKLEVLLNTNIENIMYWKSKKHIVVQCNKEKINYEKIYENPKNPFIKRFKAVVDSLGLRYKIENVEYLDFCNIVSIKTRHNLVDFTKAKEEFSHRLQIKEKDLNLSSKQGLIVFKISLEMKTLSFVEEYNNLTKLSKFRIPIYIGKNEEGKNIIFDLLDYYHWLIAGSTGQGKSNLIKVILSCIFLNRNNIARYYLLDPKKVELSKYKNLKNVVYRNTDNDILNELLKLQKEMKNRYTIFESRNIEDIDEWNEKFPNEKIGYIVVVIEEIANLMIGEHKKIFHDLLQDLGQFARGAGFRIILITQCANGDVIKKVIKINFINRICMQVDSWHDSMAVLSNKIGADLKNPGEIILKLNNSFDKIKVPLISKKEKETIMKGIERINGYE